MQALFPLCIYMPAGHSFRAFPMVRRTQVSLVDREKKAELGVEVEEARVAD